MGPTFVNASESVMLKAQFIEGDFEERILRGVFRYSGQSLAAFHPLRNTRRPIHLVSFVRIDSHSSVVSGIAISESIAWRLPV